jgi:hypothetical protein
VTTQSANRPVGAAAPAVHVDVGRLTLEGYSPAQRARFVSSLQARLTELAASGGSDWLAAAQRPLAHLDAGTLRPGAAPEEAAQRVASTLGAHLAAWAGRHA